ncbi:hypothetical protein B0H14DRAFT_3786870, partial [Mycena olivaceomarginata]
MLVSKNTTAAEVLDTLRRRSYLPSNYQLTHMLATLGRRPRLLAGSISMGQLGLGSLSHLQLRVRVPGGAGSSSRMRTPEASSSRLGASTPDSPSKNTRSQIRVADEVPVIVSPPKKRRKKEAVDETDLGVWHLSDEEIIAKSRKDWKSPIYNHYTVSLERNLDGDGNRHHLTFIFTCRVDPKNHNPQRRDRMKTSEGTANLKRTSQQCNNRRGVVDTDGDTSKNAQQDLFRSVSRYTPARHRALIALRCAASHRPFNMVRDDFYLEEVELLRPGTIVRSPETVSKDVQTLYQEGSKRVKEYFKVRSI